jgi:hypothetical protein
MRLLATDAELKHGARSPRPLLLADILCRTDLRHVVSCRTAATHSCLAGMKSPCSRRYFHGHHLVLPTKGRRARHGGGIQEDEHERAMERCRNRSRSRCRSSRAPHAAALEPWSAPPPPSHRSRLAFPHLALLLFTQPLSPSGRPGQLAPEHRSAAPGPSPASCYSFIPAALALHRRLRQLPGRLAATRAARHPRHAARRAQLFFPPSLFLSFLSRTLFVSRTEDEYDGR